MSWIGQMVAQASACERPNQQPGRWFSGEPATWASAQVRPEAEAGSILWNFQNVRRATFETHSEEATIELGRRIARDLPPKAVVLLIGNLGAGKTTLAKGIVSGLGAAAPDDVSSPTFALIHEYGNGRVYHVDLYRLEKPEQAATLGLEEIFERQVVVLVEWGERFLSLMPEERFEIHLNTLAGDLRRIDICYPTRCKTKP